MTIAFTGTRRGLTDTQRATLRARLSRCEPSSTYTHHGCCVGADAEFDALCAEMGISRTGHPALPLGHPLRAACACEVLHPLAGIWVRNKAIVQAAVEAERGLLLACPFEDAEQPRGGTWGTVRLARGQVLVVVVWPDGRLERWEAGPST